MRWGTGSASERVYTKIEKTMEKDAVCVILPIAHGAGRMDPLRASGVRTLDSAANTDRWLWSQPFVDRVLGSGC